MAFARTGAADLDLRPTLPEKSSVEEDRFRWWPKRELPAGLAQAALRQVESKQGDQSAPGLLQQRQDPSARVGPILPQMLRVLGLDQKAKRDSTEFTRTL